MKCKNIFTAIIVMLIFGSIDCMEQALSPVDRIFLNACKNDKSIDFALAQGANVFAIDPQNGFSALHYACLNDNKERIGFLIRKGLDVNLLDHEGFTPEDIFTVRRNLKQLSDENISFHDFRSKINFLKNNYKDNYRYIINYPLSLDGNGLLHYTIINEKPIKWIKFLLDNGADVNAVSQMGTPLHTLLCFRKIFNNTAMSHLYIDELVPLLIERGADLSIVGKCGYTILQSAIQFQPAWIRPILNEMIKKGIDISKADQMNHNALYEVITTYAQKDVLKILKLLFDKGCKPLIDTAGLSLMHNAVERSYSGMGDALSIIEELLKRGIGVNDIDKDGQTPLHYAAEAGSYEVVNTLLGAGAVHSCMPDKKGKTPLDLSQNNPDKKVVRLLQKAKIVGLQLAQQQRSMVLARSSSIKIEVEQELQEPEMTNMKSKQQEQKKEKIQLPKKSKRKNNQKKKLVIVEEKVQAQSSMLQEVTDDKKQVTIEEKKSEEVIISQVPHKQKKSLLGKAQDLAVKVLTGNATDAAATKTYAAALTVHKTSVRVSEPVEKKEIEWQEDDYFDIKPKVVYQSPKLSLTNAAHNPLINIPYSAHVLDKMAYSTDYFHNFSPQVEEKWGHLAISKDLGNSKVEYKIPATIQLKKEVTRMNKIFDGHINCIVQHFANDEKEMIHRQFEKEKKQHKFWALPSSSDQYGKEFRR